MRITMVLPTANASGGIRVCSIHAELLCQRGHDVLVVYPGLQQQSFPHKIRSLLKGNGWPRAALAVPSPLEGCHFQRRQLARHRPVADFDVPDADIVIATWWETAEWVAALSPAKGTKVYFIQGYELFAGMPSDRLKATWTLPMHKIVV